MSDETLPIISLSHRFTVCDHDGEEQANVSLEQRHGVLWVKNVWVGKDYRGKGLGSRMMREAVRVYGQQDMFLWVMGYADRPLDDEALMAWYARFGFEPTFVPGVMYRPATTDTSGFTAQIQEWRATLDPQMQANYSAVLDQLDDLIRRQNLAIAGGDTRGTPDES